MAWKKSALKHSQTFSCAIFEFMDMLIEHIRNSSLARALLPKTWAKSLKVRGKRTFSKH
jgi:hypothetical protein